MIIRVTIIGVNLTGPMSVSYSSLVTRARGISHSVSTIGVKQIRIISKKKFVRLPPHMHQYDLHHSDARGCWLGKKFSGQQALGSSTCANNPTLDAKYITITKKWDEAMTAKDIPVSLLTTLRMFGIFTPRCDDLMSNTFTMTSTKATMSEGTDLWFSSRNKERAGEILTKGEIDGYQSSCSAFPSVGKT